MPGLEKCMNTWMEVNVNRDKLANPANKAALEKQKQRNRWTQRPSIPYLYTPHSIIITMFPVMLKQYHTKNQSLQNREFISWVELEARMDIRMDVCLHGY